MWRLRLLGDIALASGGIQTRRLRANKYAFLLGFLSINPHRAFSRDELIDKFWPDSEIRAGRECLRTALASLRRQLDEPDLFLEGSRELVRINGDRLQTDVREFEDAVRAGNPRARDIYGGEFLPGCYDDWAILERLRLDLLFEEAPRPTAASGEPARPTESAPVRAMPLPTSRFCGRGQELENLKALTSEHRLVTLVGLGGIGKTRIALELAKSRETTQRVLFVPLAKVREPFELTGAAADALGVDKAPLETLEARLDRAISDQPTLIVLDNFEQLVENPLSKEWVGRRVEASPFVSFLTTSRIPLGIEGERLVPIGPLTLDDAREMFIDRARSVLPDFPRSDRVDELCRRLDRMPLAIVLCAARANVLSAKGMLHSLDQRFEMLRSQHAHLDDRQASLRSVLEWTCPAINPLHLALCSLSMFRGSWSFEACLAVLGPDALELLAGLRQRSLIEVECVQDENRFSMLDAVRDYAVQTADQAQIEVALLKHCDYYREFTRRTAASHGQDKWACFRAIDAEHSNIVAALETGLKLDEDRLLATMEVIDRASWCLWVRGYGASVLHIYAATEPLLGRPHSELVRAWLLKHSSEPKAAQGDYKLAVERLDQATELFLKLGLNHTATDALLHAAGFAGDGGDHEGAVLRMERMLELLEPEDLDARQIARATLAQALLDMSGGMDRAEALYQELKDYWIQRATDEGHIAVLNIGLATCLAERSEFTEADRLLRESIAISQGLGLVEWEATAWKRLAITLDLSGEAEKAQEAQRNYERLHARD